MCLIIEHKIAKKQDKIYKIFVLDKTDNGMITALLMVVFEIFL